MLPPVVFILPALNEEQAIAQVLDDLVAKISAMELGAKILVVDNGSADATSRIAAVHGAKVISEPRRGYGQACLTGIAHLPPETQIVVFLDADGSDDIENLPALLQPLFLSEADFVTGSRTLGASEPGALTPQQRFGNWLATRLLRVFFGARYTDLGPFRAIRRSALDALRMRDTNFGWTIEMQIKAHRQGLRTLEVPVNYRRRAAGVSKVSANLRAGILAGMKIIWTIVHFRFSPRGSQT
jgi:glycosyltransferase involved in cell wall biosynthesis